MPTATPYFADNASSSPSTKFCVVSHNVFWNLLLARLIFCKASDWISKLAKKLVNWKQSPSMSGVGPAVLQRHKFIDHKHPAPDARRGRGVSLRLVLEFNITVWSFRTP